MHAEHGQLDQSSIRICSGFPQENPVPEYSWWGGIPLLASNGAGMTGDTPLQIDDHSIAHSLYSFDLGLEDLDGWSQFNAAGDWVNGTIFLP